MTARSSKWHPEARRLRATGLTFESIGLQFGRTKVAAFYACKRRNRQAQAKRKGRAADRAWEGLADIDRAAAQALDVPAGTP